ncbi:class I SAM-dependent methyltransferase [Halocatena salina]|uniref:Class I SAM-dependent methyltransferase n=1 Tax=Halocatena salina TaxID=2934340 RepID=A0A8T9ZZL3_9EURY|nr:class I SAM-dependent methyltransferase [Halocatena salina]UPM42204.1 class I SAM-dependent methyltransferase [Halocatena salina]
MAQSVWHEDEAFWDTFEGYVFAPEVIEKAPAQIDHLLSLLDLPDDGVVGDVPCGVGRHAVELADRGFRVTGVDATASYLSRASERARERGVSERTEFIHEDMRDVSRPNEFDAIINLYTSFGYFEDRADDERTARNFYDSLRPGGTLFMSLTSKETLAGKFEQRTWDERDGTYFLEEHEITDNWSWMENRWIVVTDEAVQEFTVSHRLYSAYELTTLLQRVGFEDVSVYGNLDGDPYDENAAHLVIVATK